MMPRIRYNGLPAVIDVGGTCADAESPALVLPTLRKEPVSPLMVAI